MGWILDNQTGGRIDVDTYRARNQTIRMSIAARKGERIGMPEYGTDLHLFANIGVDESEIEYILNVVQDVIGENVIDIVVDHIKIEPRKNPCIGFNVCVELQNGEMHVIEFSPNHNPFDDIQDSE